MSYILESTGEFQRLERQAEQRHYSLLDELRFIPFQKNMKILDAGCGSGLLSRYLHGLVEGAELFACDQSHVRIKQAQNNSQGLSIEYFQSELESIGLEDNSMDLIVCRFVFEYLVNPIQVTKEFHRVLKPGGIAYLIDLDGVFLNLWTANDRLNHYIEELKAGLDVDLFVGRKLSSFLHAADFAEIQSAASIHHFNTPDDIQRERDNNRDRIDFAQPRLAEILGGDESFEDFKTLYLNEMLNETSSLFFNKFIAWGQKS